MIRSLVLLLAAAPAFAAPPSPGVLPLHDVTVTYRASGAAVSAIPAIGTPGAPLDMRIAWSAGQNRLLVTPSDRPQRILLDLPGHQATILDGGMRMALQLPVRDGDVQAMTLADARFTRRGQETVAGEACTDWAVQARRFTGTVCLTDDHVPLRVEGDANGQHGVVVATAIDHGRIDPAEFAVPPGYQRLEVPAMGGR